MSLSSILSYPYISLYLNLHLAENYARGNTVHLCFSHSPSLCICMSLFSIMSYLYISLYLNQHLAKNCARGHTVHLCFLECLSLSKCLFLFAMVCISMYISPSKSTSSGELCKMKYGPSITILSISKCIPILSISICISILST